MNVSYTKVGDYLMSDLKLKKGKQYNIGKYGLLKLMYLKEHNRGLYTVLLMKEQLNSYLYDVEKLVNDKTNELIFCWMKKKMLMKNLKMIIKCYG